jgi:hypothetical protein
MVLYTMAERREQLARAVARVRELRRAVAAAEGVERAQLREQWVVACIGVATDVGMMLDAERDVVEDLVDTARSLRKDQPGAVELAAEAEALAATIGQQRQAEAVRALDASVARADLVFQEARLQLARAACGEIIPHGEA